MSGTQPWLRWAILTVPVVLFGLLGLLILAVTGALALRWRSRLARAVRVLGKIASYRQSTDSDGDTWYYPQVRGQRPSGESFEFESAGSQRTPSPPAGTEVEVIIDSEHPQKLWLRGHEWRSFLPWFGMGAFLALGGFGLAIVAVILSLFLK
jgi:hypothetical protein